MNIDGQDVSIQFTGIGPIMSYRCRLDGSHPWSCKYSVILVAVVVMHSKLTLKLVHVYSGMNLHSQYYTFLCIYYTYLQIAFFVSYNIGQSPVHFTNLDRGNHRLKVIPQGCSGQIKRLSVKFYIP